MNWEKACEMMDKVESDMKAMRDTLRYLLENIETLDGKRDSLNYAYTIQEEFVDYAKIQLSDISNLLNQINKKADNIG